MGIFPVRIKFTVLLLNRHCLHVSNAKYGQMALQNNQHSNIYMLKPAKKSKNKQQNTLTQIGKLLQFPKGTSSFPQLPYVF